MRTERHVVIGCGGLGAAALHRLARAVGPRVLGLDGDEPAHGCRGTRALHRVRARDAEAALAPAAWTAWRDAERVSGQRLLHETGGLFVEGGTTGERATGEGATGDPAGIARRAGVADRHGLDFEILDAAALRRRWPQFRLTGGERALHQRRSGVVDAGRAAATHLALARGHGAEVRGHSPVRALHDAGDHVEVVLDDEVVRAAHVVVAAGAGTAALLAGLGTRLPLVTSREEVTAYATPRLLDFAPGRFPVLTWSGALDVVGFPLDDAVVTRLAEVVDLHPDAHPDAHPGPDRHDRRLAFLAEHLPGFAGPATTTTRRRAAAPDHAAVLGPVPGAPRVTVGLGAGGALGTPDATFTALFGAVLADLALTGRTPHPVGAFAPDRPVLRDRARERARP